MKKSNLFLVMILSLSTINTFLTAGNWFDKLNCDKNDPIYSTYAAWYERSDYFVDQAYHFRFWDESKPLALETDMAGEIQLLWLLRGMRAVKTDDYFSAPLIVRSLSDYAEAEFEPFSSVRVKLNLFVLSSRELLLDLKIKNLSRWNEPLRLAVVIKKDAGGLSEIRKCDDGIVFSHWEDSTKWFSTPLPEYNPHFENALISSEKPSTSYSLDNYQNLLDLLKDGEEQKGLSSSASVACFLITIDLPPGGEKEIRIIKRVDRADSTENNLEKAVQLLSFDYSPLIRQEENLYSKAPVPGFKNKVEKIVYLSGLSLILQSFYPPTGKANHPFYVFSREPAWSWGHEGQVFHESISMLALGLIYPHLAEESQRIFLDHQRNDGFIPYRIGPFVTKTFAVHAQDSTSAPFYSWTNLELYKLTKDRKFLGEFYSSGKQFVNWILSNRDKDGDGLLEWGGSSVLECVRDEYVPVWEIFGKDYGAASFVEALDLNSMVVNEMEALEKMASELGLENDAREWRAKIDSMKKLINKYLWDEESGFYYNAYWENNAFKTPGGASLKIKEIIGFLPLQAGIADKKQAQSLIRHLTEQKEFWREYGIPTLSADEAAYNPEVPECCRWNGPVWLLWNYMVMEGLKKYGYTDLAEEIYLKSLKAATLQLEKDHRFYESFSSDDHLIYSPKSYLWDSILSRMIYDFRRAK